MTRFLRQLTIALTLVAVAAPAIATAATTRGEVKMVGRVSAIASRSITVSSSTSSLTFTARAAQLRGFGKGACVEAEGVRRNGGLRLVSLTREDRCGAMSQSADGRHGHDDGPGHDAGDDHGHDGGGHR